MSRLVLTVAVEDFLGNHLGDKEAVALALEPLGGGAAAVGAVWLGAYHRQ